MDKLIVASSYYAKDLINLEYHFIVANKGKRNYLKITFYKEDFWHVIGAGGSIKEYPQLKTNKSKLFDDITNNAEYLRQIIEAHSTFQSEDYINRRVDFLELSNIIESDETIFRVVNVIERSQIKADYILKCTLKDGRIYWIFLRSRNKLYNKKVNEFDEYVIVSAFSSTKNYGLNQTKHVLIYKAKKELISNHITVLKKYSSLTDEDISNFQT